MKHEKTFEAINKLREVEIELHRLKNFLEMLTKVMDAKDEQRTWIGLTEDEIHECFEECCNLKVVDPKGGVRGSVNIFDVGRAIEAKLKERNT